MALIPIYWWNKEVRNFQISQKKFTKQPWANGVILLACVAVAMLLANLPFTKGLYHGFLHTELTIHIASPNGLIDWFFPRGMTMEKFINDILMVIFFFTVGLEIKREVVCGELSSFKKAILPVIAAFGGVIMPALIYTIVNHGTAAASGWGIPTATDIAFAVGILSILGDRVPISLKVFLTALAIADDLIAILVVALFYGGHINMPLLAIALMVILFVALMKKLGEKRIGLPVVTVDTNGALLYDSGCRVQELCDIRIKDVITGNNPTVKLHGKGDKYRTVIISEGTGSLLKEYISRQRNSALLNQPLIVNRTGRKLSRDGVQYIIDKYVHEIYAENTAFPDHVHCHQFRHSKAMHMLAAGINIVYIRDFLGHEDISTTQIYIRADNRLKNEAINALAPKIAEETSLPDWRTDQDLLGFLNSFR